MKCPFCHKDIPNEEIAKSIGSAGGKKSRRTLTPEKAKEMVEIRKLKRKGGDNG